MPLIPNYNYSASLRGRRIPQTPQRSMPLPRAPGAAALPSPALTGLLGGSGSGTAGSIAGRYAQAPGAVPPGMPLEYRQVDLSGARPPGGILGTPSMPPMQDAMGGFLAQNYGGQQDLGAFLNQNYGAIDAMGGDYLNRAMNPPGIGAIRDAMSGGGGSQNYLDRALNPPGMSAIRDAMSGVSGPGQAQVLPRVRENQTRRVQGVGGPVQIASGSGARRLER